MSKVKKTTKREILKPSLNLVNIYVIQSYDFLYAIDYAKGPFSFNQRLY